VLINSATVTSNGTDDPNPTNNSSNEVRTKIVAKFVPTSSTMTNSAFQVVDNLEPWTITDFEILMNAQNTIVATNPGQFYYHQRGTNSFPATTSWEFSLSWPDKFSPQTTGGMPIHAYVQLAGQPNTWTDWTPQSTGICWNAAQNTCSGFDGKITVDNVPAGAIVWVTVHLDYNLKGSTQASDFTKKPILYAPFQSDVVIKAQVGPDRATWPQVGVSSSSTSLWGRGKKATMAYGTLTDKSTGLALANTWVRISQGTSNATALTGSDGFYLFYDGQACTTPDGVAGGCFNGATSIGTWTFANGSNVATTVRILGTETTPATPTVPAAGAAAAYPTGKTHAEVKVGSTWTAKNPPSYDFGVAKGSGYNRDWRFSTP
jgi:hypothetical protein